MRAPEAGGAAAHRWVPFEPFALVCAGQACVLHAVEGWRTGPVPSPLPASPARAGTALSSLSRPLLLLRRPPTCTLSSDLVCPGDPGAAPSWGAVSSCGLVAGPLGIRSSVLAACVCALPDGLSEPQLFICKMDPRAGPRWLQGKAVHCVSLMASFRGAACGQSLAVSPVWVGSGQRTRGTGCPVIEQNRTMKQRRSCCCHGRGADAGKRAAPALSSTRGAPPRPLVWAPAARLGPASWPLGGGA